MADMQDFKYLEGQIRKLSHAIEQSPVSVVITNLQGKIEYVNPKFTEVSGYTAEEVIGKNPRILKSGETPSEDYKQLWQAITSGKEWRGEFHNRRKDGKLYWESAFLSPIRNEAGTITHFLAIKEDITDQKRVEQALQESEKRFRAITQLTSDYIYAAKITPGGKVITQWLTEPFQHPDQNGDIEATDPYHRLTGYTLDEINAAGWLAFVHPDDLPRAQAFSRQLCQNHSQTIEYRIVTKDGKIRWLRNYARPEWNESQQYITGILGAIQDITEQKQQSERGHQQERLAAVGQLAAGVAHDFNNILTVMMGTAQLAALQPDLPSLQKEDLNTIQMQGERAAHLIRQILDFSRKTVVQRIPVHLTPFVKEVVKLLERILPESIKIAMALEDINILVDASLLQIQQVISNLAVNARDAMPQGGELKIGLKAFHLPPGVPPPVPELKAGNWVVLSISDTGKGIPSHVLPHIYEPFFSTKQPGEGTGLGLAQVYGIVKQHHGEIALQTHPGKGTTFTIYLPQSVCNQDKKVADAAPQTFMGQRQTILLVEDDPAVRKVANRMLQTLNYQVLIAENGEEALKAFGDHHHEIELVLSDVVMPKLGGLDLIKKLRSKQPGLKVVMMSGYATPIPEKEELIGQVSALLEKPLTLDQMEQAIGKALNPPSSE